ncbi:MULTISPECIES: hypothetical protein [unclassified Mesorhizobium]|uniref:hypothetical protein n=1 Tax=unclassified Mesorhizobium TaxID=325217 RepID=UPI000FE64821|nr:MULTISPECIES: hypothetical protein [unclassified Mesorhizobium]RWG41303.1 MAG: hypothetical protein EOQ62_28055 [Mesorhizobium sp.]RWI28863.1 MAG: hypothetical protein EOQ92_06455 [Mesorhizobium sp.]RWK53017.1 MAG: hypothetical protein EOR47_02845 [Mesorhizobium sp.]RWK97924.1 MAG: hypothetical protein EOR53_03725 [Mesorhizobium sp.]RWL14511.1 MAG: hypothetical protein EOR45_00520 [Mesorhizobium sp.]
MATGKDGSDAEPWEVRAAISSLMPAQAAAAGQRGRLLQADAGLQAGAQAAIRVHESDAPLNR